jgi:hypothetical protein
MDCTVGRDSGDAQTRPLLERDAVGKWDGLLGRYYDVLSGRAKRAIALGGETPRSLTDAGGGDPIADCVDHSCPVAVRDDTRERHSHAERILALFHVTGVDPGGSYSDSDLPWARLGVWHFTHNQDARRRALPIVPSRFHDAPI